MVKIKNLFEALGYTNSKQHIQLLSVMNEAGCFANGRRFPTERASVFSHDLLTQEFIDNNAVYDWANTLMQEYMLRKHGTERQQISEIELSTEQKKSVVESLKDLGYLAHVKPQEQQHDIVLFLGASEKAIYNRLGTLQDYLSTAKQQPDIYILGGKRPLWPAVSYGTKGNMNTIGEPISLQLIAERILEKGEYQGDDLLFDIQEIFNEYFTKPVINRNESKEIAGLRGKVMQHEMFKDISWPTETDMMVRMFDQEGITYNITDTPLRDNGARPNTHDTVKHWQKEYSNKYANGKNILMVSSQPHVEYQRQLPLTLLGDKYNIDMIGRGVNDINKVRVKEVFDSIARTVYAGKENILSKMQEQNLSNDNLNTARGFGK